MPEVIGNSINSPTSTLTSSITNVSTSIPVNAPVSPDAWPTTGDFRVLIETELILVNAASGGSTTLNVVTRGVEGTTAASHGSGISVDVVLTKAALDNLYSSTGTSGTQSSALFNYIFAR